jgi:hypothetical protein
VYVNYCHQCGRALSPTDTARCERCGWLHCECGACGCNYELATSRPVLAMVPPGWGGAVPRHVLAPHAEGFRGHAAARVAIAALLLAAAAGVAVATMTILPKPNSSTASTDLPGSSPPAVIAPPVGAAPQPMAEPVVQAAADDAGVPSASPTAAEAPAPLPTVLYVANTDGQGAYLRSEPRELISARIVAWRDGTALTPLETTAVAEAGTTVEWVRLRDPNGRTGWIRRDYLSPTPR